MQLVTNSTQQLEQHVCGRESQERHRDDHAIKGDGRRPDTGDSVEEGVLCHQPLYIYFLLGCLAFMALDAPADVPR